MDFRQEQEPNVEKPIIIAAMQEMGNVGSIVINFINESLRTKTFRISKTPFPTYVVDRGGYIDLPDESWEYRYTDDLIIFGGGKGQPQSTAELNALCQDHNIILFQTRNRQKITQMLYWILMRIQH